MPAFTDYSMKGRTYRYYTGTPLYPFGYGLSYADMQLSELSADRDCACVTITNNSDISADEVIELYIRDNKSQDAPVNPVLCGFARVHLDPGAEKLLTIPIQPRAFSVVTGTGERVAGSGSWTLYAGFGQPDSRTEELTGQKCLSVLIQ